MPTRSPDNRMLAEKKPMGIRMNTIPNSAPNSACVKLSSDPIKSYWIGHFGFNTCPINEYGVP
jgi:hypothetical protein